MREYMSQAYRPPPTPERVWGGGARPPPVCMGVGVGDRTQCWVGVGTTPNKNEDIWNQNSGPEGQNFDSKFTAPLT